MIHVGLFLDERTRPHCESLFLDVLVVYGGQDDDFGLWNRMGDLLARLEAVGIRNVQVEHDDVRNKANGRFERSIPVRDAAPSGSSDGKQG